MGKLYLDMDGTMANFYKELHCMERMYTDKTFFARLEPHALTFAVATILQQHRENIYILSACLDESVERQKREWLREYLPNLKKDNIIFTGIDESKADRVKPESADVLIDDYSKNLNDWSNYGAYSVKALNGINNIKRISQHNLTIDVNDALACYKLLKMVLR